MIDRVQLSACYRSAWLESLYESLTRDDRLVSIYVKGIVMSRIINGPLSVVVLSLSLSFGCGSSDSGGYPSTTKVIGAAGGEIAVSGSAGEFALNVPPEALSGDVEITIQARGEADGMSSVVKFEPSGLLFEKPVKLSFPAASGSNLENPAVFYRGDNGALQPIESR